MGVENCIAIQLLYCRQEKADRLGNCIAIHSIAGREVAGLYCSLGKKIVLQYLNCIVT